MLLEILPKEIEDIIIDYKENLEYLENVKEHKIKYKKILNTINSLDPEYYITSKDEFVIFRLYYRNNRYYGYFTDKMILEDKKYQGDFNEYINNGLIHEDSFFDCLKFDFKYNYGKIIADSTEDLGIY